MTRPNRFVTRSRQAAITMRCRVGSPTGQPAPRRRCCTPSERGHSLRAHRFRDTGHQTRRLCRDAGPAAWSEQARTRVRSPPAPPAHRETRAHRARLFARRPPRLRCQQPDKSQPGRQHGQRPSESRQLRPPPADNQVQQPAAAGPEEQRPWAWEPRGGPGRRESEEQHGRDSGPAPNPQPDRHHGAHHRPPSRSTYTAASSSRCSVRGLQPELEGQPPAAAGREIGELAGHARSQRHKSRSTAQELLPHRPQRADRQRPQARNQRRDASGHDRRRHRGRAKRSRAAGRVGRCSNIDRSRSYNPVV